MSGARPAPAPLEIAEIRFAPVRWPLRAALRTARGELRERAGLRVELRDASGGRGAGEALPLPEHAGEPATRTRAALDAAASTLRGARGELDALLDRVDRLCAGAPVAACALDVALHDLAARRAGCAVATLLTATPRGVVAVNALVDARDPVAAASAARAARDAGYATIKLKLGAAPLEHDLERVRAVREALGTGVRLRLDANGAWDEAMAREALVQLAPLDIELLEQPVAASALDALARVAAAAPLPVAADESLALPGARERLRRGALTPIAVLKPAALGGLRAAARLALAAREHGVRCLVTTSIDGPLGTAAALQLAAAVADPGLACGLATLGALDLEVPAALQPRGGALHLPATPGLGLEAGS